MRTWYFDSVENNNKKKDIVLDTSSINKILKDTDLSKKFFDKIFQINAIAVVPSTALCEISNDPDPETFKKFNALYKQEENLRFICERLDERIKREINHPIESNEYANKEVDLDRLFNDTRFLKHIRSYKNLKTNRKENCQENQKKFLEQFKTTPEERNKTTKIGLEEEGCRFLIEYINDKNPPCWALGVFEKWPINFPKKEIYLKRNRYKQINLLQCLMRINMHRSLLSGSSKLSARPGDIFDMDIASFSAYCHGFISEDEGQIHSLEAIKSLSKELGFDNKYKTYHRIKDFISV